ncbi:Npun_F5749 family FMN-dependent PPOX-type flavoprotein [Spirulina major]|uniref:Npun_F5749 family FMN-dependent PPOX-type flavoprotein n=1 Tax=Spirulina major TaxID=270636 RepID=UPI000932B49E|nr:Npun_F5749 family FMN-dependent PPOX-type flavoprotein [Spirulina major]
MSLAPWRSPLARALHRNRALPNARYLQLATVSPMGDPANRTVVFRGFSEAGDRLRMISDRRSEKIAHLQHHPWAELCWYFPKTREQFRLLGQVAIITAELGNPEDQAERLTLWREISDNARAQFGWPAPKQPVQGGEEAIAVDPHQPPAAFCLLLFTAQQVDHLLLRGDPQTRHLYTQTDTQWAMQPVNP